MKKANKKNKRLFQFHLIKSTSWSDYLFISSFILISALGSFLASAGDPASNAVSGADGGASTRERHQMKQHLHTDYTTC